MHEKSLDGVEEQREPLTPERLDAIEARASAATPGPWTADGACVVVAGDLCDQVMIAHGWPWRRNGERAPNAAFAAHARDDVPALVAEVRRLRLALAHLSIEAPDGLPCWCYGTNDYHDDDCLRAREASGFAVPAGPVAVRAPEGP